MSSTIPSTFGYLEALEDLYEKRVKIEKINPEKIKQKVTKNLKKAKNGVFK